MYADESNVRNWPRSETPRNGESPLNSAKQEHPLSLRVDCLRGYPRCHYAALITDVSTCEQATIAFRHTVVHDTEHDHFTLTRNWVPIQLRAGHQTLGIAPIPSRDITKAPLGVPEFHGHIRGDWTEGC
jgi:hypothetical protein